MGDRQDEEDEDETETETEGEVPQEELPQSLRGQTVHRIRIPTKLWAHHPIKQGDLINQLGGEEEEILLLHLPLLVGEVMKGGKEKT